MPLTTLTVTATNGYVLPSGTPGSGQVVLRPVAEATGGGYVVVAADTSFVVADGVIAGPSQIASNAQATTLQYLVYEQIIGADNPLPYVVTPTGSVLDLSTASRGTLGQATPIYVLASTVGQPNGVATLGQDGILTPAQRPPSSTLELWQIAEQHAGLSNPGALIPYSGNDPNNGITLASGTYENFDFICSELILPNNGTKLVNCRITCGNASYGVRLDANTGQETGRYLEHCQITALGVALSGAGFTARLCEVVNNGDDSCRLGRSHAEPTVLELCHFHGFRPQAGAHADGVQIVTPPAADVVIWGCSISMDTATGYTLPADAGYTGALFVDTSDVPIGGGDPEPSRLGGIWADACKLYSSNNYSVVIDGPNVDIRNCTLLPGTTAVESIQSGIVVTGGNNVDTNGTPIVDTNIHGDPRPVYLRVGDPRQSGGAPRMAIVSGFLTSGNVSAVNTGAVFLPIAGTSQSIAAAVGDQVSAQYGATTNAGAGTYYDVGVLVGGTLVRLLHSAAFPPDSGYEGMPATNPDNPNAFFGPNGLPWFTVTSGDLDSGNVVFCLCWKSTGTGSLLMGPALPVSYTLYNNHQ